MKLIKMTSFVLEQEHILLTQDCPSINLFRKRIVNYAKFLSQPLELGMFVPCDLEGNVLEVPLVNNGGYEMKLRLYQQAKERVLFVCEGYEGSDKLDCNDMSIIKEFIKRKFIIENVLEWDLTLTQSAIKKLGL